MVQLLVSPWFSRSSVLLSLFLLLLARWVKKEQGELLLPVLGCTRRTGERTREARNETKQETDEFCRCQGENVDFDGERRRGNGKTGTQKHPRPSSRSENGRRTWSKERGKLQAMYGGICWRMGKVRSTHVCTRKAQARGSRVAPSPFPVYGILILSKLSVPVARSFCFGVDFFFAKDNCLPQHYERRSYHCVGGQPSGTMRAACVQFVAVYGARCARYLISISFFGF